MSYWRHNPQQQIKLSGDRSGRSFLGNLLRLIGVITLLVLGLMFSIAVFTVLAIGAGVLWCYLLWKTRKLRRQLKEQQGMGYPPPENTTHSREGEIIEGEVIEVVSENSSSMKKDA